MSVGQARPGPLADPATGLDLDLLDLLIPFASAREAAISAASDRNWLDASLLVAGCTQVVEDHIHRSEALLDRVSGHLAGAEARPGVPSRVLAAGGSDRAQGSPLPAIDLGPDRPPETGCSAWRSTSAGLPLPP